MPKSNYAINLATILSEIHKRLLKEKGFKRKGNSFNRVTEDGLVHVIGFQSGLSVSPEYGTFVINFGVFVPEVFALFGHKPKEFIYDYYCEYALRRRIAAGHSTNERGISNEIWFSLSDEPMKTVDTLVPLIEQECSEFFNKLESREQVIEFLRAKHKSSNDRIVLAMILLNKGNKEEAMALLKEQYDHAVEHKGHGEYLIELAQRLELQITWQ
jgi:hypothetical protein